MKEESSEETLHRVLGEYNLGTKLRALRLRKKISLVDLGKHTGLSASMLSQLENGKLIPTLPTLARIAMVFDIGLEYFFADKQRKKLFSVVRGTERMRFPDRAGNPRPNYFFEVLAFSAQEKGMQGYLAEFTASEGKPEEHFHEGAEFFYVLTGEVAILFEGEEHILAAGDCVYFDSSEPHGYRGLMESRALVVTTPPRL
ncbi:MAG: helix-turn-helix transcriptional regulator [Acidobacteria bacterium]|nr:helix-turn-helix transcriptional regulator [Acidobacteriota bacterium]